MLRHRMQYCLLTVTILLLALIIATAIAANCKWPGALEFGVLIIEWLHLISVILSSSRNALRLTVRAQINQISLHRGCFMLGAAGLVGWLSGRLVGVAELDNCGVALIILSHCLECALNLMGDNDQLLDAE